MKKPSIFLTLTIAGAIASMIPLSSNAQTTQKTISPGFQPMEVTGTSGGPTASSCGNLATSPNLALTVTADTSIHFRLQSSGKPTLKIDGPQDFDLCVPAHDGSTVEIPGQWPPGDYQIFVGDLDGGSHGYTLKISDQ
ncbi:hypothetical protein PMG71_09945 [Roseofilum sp. BLCC_M154]|uniref:Uncharacterized protein n=1 Tax=Roseofilum acuticapitatum BLCC-M154 TaxID=3022444 RepID=A0ABT7AT47_9CYAN|nr:hypothetical protein [Roseofilum acuticapitatum]MDJ1169747.1 hypothetical protein [Roseofilum acuticapitatum BLCC-M154]